VTPKVKQVHTGRCVSAGRCSLAALVRGLAWLLAAFACQGAISEPAQAKIIFGVVPDLPSTQFQPRSLTRAAQASARPARRIPYGGGPVLHSNRTHLIFWAPARSGLRFPARYESLIERFLARVAADSRKPSNVYGSSGQYTDSGGPAAYDSSYRGALVANDSLPANGCQESPAGPGWDVCLTDEQLHREIEHVVAADRLPSGPTDIYFLLTPEGFGSCTDSSSAACALGGATGYCGYHSVTPTRPTGTSLLYAVIPYSAVPGHCQSESPRPNASTADRAISSLSHEHNETVTDPFGDAWSDSSGNEIGDLCTTDFGSRLGGSGARAFNEVIDGGHYFLQEEWSNADRGCAARAKAASVSFSSRRTTRVRHDRVSVSFYARARDADGVIVNYEWFFGDRSREHVRGRQVSHTFSRAGAYRVVLRTTDSWGNYGFAVRLIRVSGRLRVR